MRFTKMHGLGNDYVYVNGFEEPVDDASGLARLVSDRHFGIGSDGLILVLPSDEADVRMRMFNADGSEAEMCGNGIRCVCKLAHDHDLSRENPMRVQTASGVLTLRYTLGGDGKVDQVTVDMGEPILEPARAGVNIPDLTRIVNHSIKTLVKWPGDLPEGWITRSGLDQRMTCVSMGNPHAVLYCTDAAAVPLERVGPVLEHHHVFPKRVNAHFVQVHNEAEVTMRTWERGSGLTLACGTGASAVCVAGVLTGRSGRKILAHLPGGDLILEWKASDNHVYMTGPATEVFEGQWPEN